MGIVFSRRQSLQIADRLRVRVFVYSLIELLVLLSAEKSIKFNSSLNQQFIDL